MIAMLSRLAIIMISNRLQKMATDLFFLCVDDATMQYTGAPSSQDCHSKEATNNYLPELCMYRVGGGDFEGIAKLKKERGDELKRVRHGQYYKWIRFKYAMNLVKQFEVFLQLYILSCKYLYD